MTPDAGNIFKGTAWHYRRFRRPYPDELFKSVVDYYGLDGKGRLLDLGCGTGEFTVPLASCFEEATGVDPSADMISEAKIRTEEVGAKNIRWIEGRAEDVDMPPHTLRLTTAGVSFHWMDQALVFKKIYAATEKGGGMAIAGDMSPVRGKDKTEDWKMKRKELIIKYLGEERRAGDNLHKDFIPVKKPFETLIAESPFKTFDSKTFEYATTRNIDEIIGFFFSTSYSNQRLLGKQADQFEKELRQELLKLNPSNQFIEEGKLELFLMKK